MSLHLTDDQLLDRIYGLSEADGEHLQACPDCQVRLSRMQQRRDQLIESAPISNQQLRQQRRAILNRLSVPAPALRLAWAPVAAAVVLLAGFAFTPKVEAPPAAPVVEVVETGWFEETYSATRVIEPRAATPIRRLFWEGIPE